MAAEKEGFEELKDMYSGKELSECFAACTKNDPTRLPFPELFFCIFYLMLIGTYL
jgi:hypothetical protein